jgi:hypothetical protein
MRPEPSQALLHITRWSRSRRHSNQLKFNIIVFLVGVILFSFSYLAVLWAMVDFDTWFIASKERLEWEKLFWSVKKSPETYIKSAKRAVAVALIAGGVSTFLFISGLCWLIRVAANL